MKHTAPTALIAEDEPLLASALQTELAQAWPELQVLALVGDGASAVAKALQFQPDVLFFDIRMPGLSGLDAAAELADRWHSEAAPGAPFPALVFVTAYDQYAMAAFEAQAIDYLLKPVQAGRLQKTVARLQRLLASQTPAGVNFETTLQQLRGLLGPNAPSAAAPLKMIQASVGSTIRMLPIADVVYFEAADKYLRVISAEREYLIRTPLKELLPQLDVDVFWQIHRGTVVNSTCIEAVTRDEAGKLSLSLRGRSEKLPVSRLYVHLFKAM
ncbi:MAG: LytR/AlgR family response regulator transcription factor [Rhodoferax sp.]